MSYGTITSHWLTNQYSHLVVEPEDQVTKSIVFVIMDDRLKEWNPAFSHSPDSELIRIEPRAGSQHLESIDHAITKDVCIVVACNSSPKIMNSLIEISALLRSQNIAVALLLNTTTPVAQLTKSREYELARSFDFSILFSSLFTLNEDLERKRHCIRCSPLLAIESTLEWLMCGEDQS